MISFIVTAYNEEGNIAPTIATLTAAIGETTLSVYEIIIIDDGSKDGSFAEITEIIAKHENVRCVRHPENRGLGSSVRTGIDAAKYPQFMIIPGDNDMHHDFILSMLTYRDHAEIILSAPLNKEIRPVSRNVISMFYQMLYMVTFRLFFNYINGPGIWPTARARAINLRSRRFAIISEMNVKLLRSGATYAEIPGYFQAGPKARGTVTPRNLAEVLTSYFFMVYEVHIRNRAQFSHYPTRIPVSFIARKAAAASAEASAR